MELKERVKKLFEEIYSKKDFLAAKKESIEKVKEQFKQTKKLAEELCQSVENNISNKETTDGFEDRIRKHINLRMKGADSSDTVKNKDKEFLNTSILPHP